MRFVPNPETDSPQSSSFPSQLMTTSGFLLLRPKGIILDPHSIISKFGGSNTETWPLVTTSTANITLRASHVFPRLSLGDFWLNSLKTPWLCHSPYTAARVSLGQSLGQNLPLTSHLTPVKSQGLHKCLQTLTWSNTDPQPYLSRASQSIRPIPLPGPLCSSPTGLPLGLQYTSTISLLSLCPSCSSVL